MESSVVRRTRREGRQLTTHLLPNVGFSIQAAGRSTEQFCSVGPSWASCMGSLSHCIGPRVSSQPFKQSALRKLNHSLLGKQMISPRCVKCAMTLRTAADLLSCLPEWLEALERA